MYQTRPGKILIVEGIPGCGKTTFCKSYAAAFSRIPGDVVIMEEWVDEKILSDYLSDMKNKATYFQYEAQRQSVLRLHNAISLAKSGKTVLIDRSLLGNRCFAEVQYEEGYISIDSIEEYRNVFSFHKVLSKKERIDIQIETLYLKCDIETAMERIRKRNRIGESGYSAEYLAKLKQKHDDMFMFKNNAKVVNVNANLKISSEGLLVDIKYMVEVF